MDSKRPDQFAKKNAALPGRASPVHGKWQDPMRNPHLAADPLRFQPVRQGKSVLKSNVHPMMKLVFVKRFNRSAG
jgi:hypothetical protein